MQVILSTVHFPGIWKHQYFPSGGIVVVFIAVTMRAKCLKMRFQAI